MALVTKLKEYRERDDLKQAEKKTQDLTDKYCKEIESVEAKKKKEIMEI